MMDLLAPRNDHLTNLLKEIGKGLAGSLIDFATGWAGWAYYTTTDFGHKFLAGIRQPLEPRPFEIVTLIDTANPSRSDNDNRCPTPSRASWREETPIKVRKPIELL